MAVQEQANMEETNTQSVRLPQCVGAVLRAELVQSNLINTFNLRDLVGLPESRRPKFRAKDVFEDDLFAKLQGKETNNLVLFKISPRRSQTVTERRRRLAHLQNRQSKYPTLSLLAYRILKSQAFNRIIVSLIFLNAFVLGLQADVSGNKSPSLGLRVYALGLDVVDWGILVMFLVEIVLQWLDDFRHFWRNTGNVFYFTVTMVSVLPVIIHAFRPDARDLAGVKLLKNLRILRSLKLLPKFTHFRLILLSISKSCADMVPILGLFLLLAYIFAWSGVVLFENYSHSQMKDLVYRNGFIDIHSAFITLFMVFTLDHWVTLVLEMVSVPVLSTPVCYIYVILWLFISISFHNVVVGFMAKKFQGIRTQRSKEVEDHELHTKAEDTILHRATHHSTQVPSGGEQAEGKEDPDPSLAESDWQACVQQNMEMLLEQAREEKVTWPRDKLFRYFELLELLQVNLDKRKKLQERCGWFSFSSRPVQTKKT